MYLIVRSTYTADDILVDRVTRMDHVEVLLGYETLEILGEQHVSGIRVPSRADSSERTLDIDGVFVEIGLLPNTAFAMDVLALNDQGEIVVDCNQRWRTWRVCGWGCHQRARQTGHYCRWGRRQGGPPGA